MPELPEVETIARTLREGGRGGAALLGCEFREIRVLWNRTLQMPASLEFEQRLPGQVIKDIQRRAKYIVFSLSSDFLIIHLRMSGDLRVEPSHDKNGNPIPFGKYDRVSFFFEPDTRLVFEDTRKFGRVWLVSDLMEVLNNLGPEPFDPAFTMQMFHQMLKSRRRQLKPLLMDQRFLAGLGNIYTDEALHLARLHPLSVSDQINELQAEQLLLAIRKVLRAAIEHNGASIDWVYRGGNFQNQFQVYQRTGQACDRCGDLIERIVVGQRGTHFCPTCQPPNP
jgi:formamidopyrimidine-DNA glycosylase